MPFMAREFVHRRVQSKVKSTSMRTLLEECVDQGSLPEIDTTTGPSIIALVDLTTAFQYDHTRSLQHEERLQYRHWQAQGVRSEDLWFFNVLQSRCLKPPIPAQHHCSRQCSKVFKLLDRDAAVALLEQHVEVAGRPAWLDEHEIVDLCIQLPDVFARLVEGVDRVAVPSPYSVGLFSTPGWFKAMLQPGLRAAFADTAVPNAAALAVEPDFSLKLVSELATDMREVFTGLKPAACLDVWIARLQGLCDTLQPDHKLPVDMECMVELMLYTGMLKNSDHLRKAILDGVSGTSPGQHLQGCGGVLTGDEVAREVRHLAFQAYP